MLFSSPGTGLLGTDGSMNTDGDTGVDLSIVVPFYNEAPSLPTLVAEIGRALEDGPTWELVLVDDGSTDDYREGLDGLEPDLAGRIRLVSFRRNLGKASALAAGFGQVSGRIVLTLDADLQDDPSMIPKLLEPLEEGFDMVIGRKAQRQDPLSRRLASWMFNSAARLTSGLKLHDINSGFKAMRREVVEGMGLYGEMHRFLPMLASWRGFRVTEISVTHRPRAHGKSRYGPARAWRGMFDLLTVTFLTRYHKRPMHLLGGIASILMFFGSAISVYLLGFWLSGGSLQERPLLLFGILLILLSGQVFTLGLLGEMITYFNHRSDLTPYIRSSGKLRPPAQDDPATDGEE
jgi:glycosyltransferase involved in cell wall biosynthesis